MDAAGARVSDSAGIASVAAVIGEPARARMLSALMGGMALTATDLAIEAGVTPSTASAHLARLLDASFLTIERQGRHRYYRLAGAGVAELLEGMMGFAARGTKIVRPGPSDPRLRAARVCYDHLAGESGVRLFDSLKARGILIGEEGVNVSVEGRAFFEGLGIDTGELAKGRRPLCRTCLDWSERRAHLAGALGAALLNRIFQLRWARRDPGSRTVTFSPHGTKAFRAWLD